MAVTSIDNLVICRRTDDLELVALVSPTTALGANSTSIATAIGLGFTFNFDGVAYTTCALSANGFLRLAGTLTSGTNSNLFAVSTNVVLAPWYDSMETVTSGGYIKYEVQGTAPLRRFVAEWYCNHSTIFDATNYRRAKMQVVLYETLDWISYRYGALEVGGSPGNTSSASIGFKGNTSVVSTNYRCLAADNLTLGGRTSPTSTSERSYAGEFPTWTYDIRPAYPMCGRVLPVGPERLAGVQDPFAEPLQAFANNVNWHYCLHAPPLVNISPEYQGGTLVAGDQHLVVPVTPSADGLTYTVYLGTYNSAAATLDFDLWRDAAADPQPGTGGDWSSIATASLVVGAGGYQWWTSFTAVIPPSTEYLRLRLRTSAGQAGVLSALIVPAPISEPPSATTASGWTRAGIAQVIQQGAGIHPELLNRYWLNIARTMRDREQMVWSMTRADAADYVLATSSSHVVRTYACAPACLKGQRGATLAVRLYAYDTGGATVWVRERGGNACKLTVAANSEYRLITGTLQIVSDVPTIEVTVDVGTALRIAALTLVWTPGD